MAVDVETTIEPGVPMMVEEVDAMDEDNWWDEQEEELLYKK